MFRNKKAPHISTGSRGERAAALFLLLRGYRILERNYRCPIGEIDIVALKKGVIIFVEVRTRRPDALVDPITSITDLKLAHLMDAAKSFLTERGHSLPCRFDLITVISEGRRQGRIRHYKDCFQTTDERAVSGKRLKNWFRRRPRM